MRLLRVDLRRSLPLLLWLRLLLRRLRARLLLTLWLLRLWLSALRLGLRLRLGGLRTLEALRVTVLLGRHTDRSIRRRT